ncbi:secondary thiamine-phosphate synthase enzyme YjbQ [Methylomonas paludis]|uniref:Secondary thiamine-phosphate synthase enzyme YjbQ n=1 Tax=Methylomonas paludis TaxID=1173101 RepID=A0A975MNB8_9GAMM|nr:secondary thiamine-phosphate synthase enzyme YjbQ [Methylomonas paludis]QWF70945.1 secondary thiamine-phosphate synthase enzyme YjbQ [Methylomonas paludis]
MWLQKSLQINAKPRGFHLITGEIVGQLAELKQFKIGLAQFFLQHTSASLTINENADADVRRDMENWFSRAVAENQSYFRHTLEGPDDMPAHIKTVLLGSSLTIPISEGHLALGIWQGIYLGEHRHQAGTRTIIVTLYGE